MRTSPPLAHRTALTVAQIQVLHDCRVDLVVFDEHQFFLICKGEDRAKTGQAESAVACIVHTTATQQLQKSRSLSWNREHRV